MLKRNRTEKVFPQGELKIQNFEPQILINEKTLAQN
jgi:hypothetical protein